MINKYLSIPAVLMIALSIVTLATASVILPPRHIDPNEVTPEKPSPLALLNLYSIVVDALVTENFTLAKQQLSQAFEVFAPEDIRYVLDRFNELMGDEIDFLNITDFSIEEAKELIYLGLMLQANKIINEGLISLAKANITYFELQTASTELKRRLAVDLGSTIINIEDIIQRYLEEFRHLMDLGNITEWELIETELSVSINVSEAWVGSVVEVSGSLVDENETVLSNRTIVVHFGGIKETVRTDVNGSYIAYIRVPYTYVPVVLVYSEYVPSLEDLGKYKATISDPITLKLLYVVPNLTALVNKNRFKPLDVINLTGYVEPIDQMVWVKAFGISTNLTTADLGFFNLSIEVPPNIAEGTYSIYVGTYANKTIAPIFTKVDVTVYRIPVEVSVNVPAVAFSGIDAVFSGRVLDINGSPVNAIVIIEGFGKEVKVNTMSEGYFEAVINVPATHPSNWVGIKVRAVPKDPWYRSATVKATVLTLNPYLIIIPAFLAIMMFKLAWPRKYVRREGEVAQAIGIERPKPKPLTVRPKVVGTIPRYYFEAVKQIEKTKGIKLEPHHTPREYLKLVKPHIGKASEPFEKLTHILESVIYGEKQPDVEKAKKLLEEVRRALT